MVVFCEHFENFIKVYHIQVVYGGLVFNMDTQIIQIYVRGCAVGVQQFGSVLLLCGSQWIQSEHGLPSLYD